MKIMTQWELQPGSIVIAYQQSVKEYITNNYNEEFLSQDKEIVTYKIHGK